MRTFSCVIVLLGTIFLTHHILAQQVQNKTIWYDQSWKKWGSPITDSYLEAFGVADGEAKFLGNAFNTKEVRIEDFYFAGGKASHNVDQLRIDRFWVTSDTIGRVKSFNAKAGAYGRVAIEKYILQVGSQSIEAAGTREFGIDQEVLPNVTLTNTSVSNGKKPVETKSDGAMSTKWGLSGNFGIENFGKIGDADVSGGTFGNAGEVTHLKYSGGIYENNGGHIQTLSLAASSGSQDWGKVDTLIFDSNNNGLITLTGFVDGETLGFSGIDVQEKVNFANGKVVLDMTKVVSDLLAKSSASSYRRDANVNADADWATLLRREFGNEAFTVANIFGVSNFENEDASNIAVMRGTGSDQDEVVDIVVNGERHAGWQIESTSTPEPATLVLFGLGLAGLGLTSHRRRK